MFEYARAFQIHGDGVPLLIEYKDNYSHFCYVVMKSDIADSSKFNGKLEKNVLFDLETPYGYGGPLTDHIVPPQSQVDFLHQMKEYCLKNGIVSQFFRFHPLFMNQETLESVVETAYLKESIYIDTTSPELIWKNLDSKNRNMIRKAIKSGVVIRRDSIDNYSDFLEMYCETMTKDDADDYYFFNKTYFEAQRALSDNSSIFYAVLDGKTIAGAVFYHNHQFIHYHLAGTKTSFRKYSPNNLLLYEAACWANKQGISKMHLGGGIIANDSLFGFKKQFNKNGQIPFYIGKIVFDEDKYNFLNYLRKTIDSSFDLNNPRMIQYRA